jgi:hypothetical protein
MKKINFWPEAVLTTPSRFKHVMFFHIKKESFFFLARPYVGTGSRYCTGTGTLFAHIRSFFLILFSLLSFLFLSLSYIPGKRKKREVL